MISRSTAVGAALRMYGLNTLPEATEDAIKTLPRLGDGRPPAAVIAISRDERLLVRVNRVSQAVGGPAVGDVQFNGQEQGQVTGVRTCSVSRQGTSAQFRLNSAAEVLSMVTEFAEKVGEPTPAA